MSRTCSERMNCPCFPQFVSLARNSDERQPSNNFISLPKVPLFTGGKDKNNSNLAGIQAAAFSSPLFPSLVSSSPGSLSTLSFCDVCFHESDGSCTQMNRGTGTSWLGTNGGILNLIPFSDQGLVPSGASSSTGDNAGCCSGTNSCLTSSRRGPTGQVDGSRSRSSRGRLVFENPVTIGSEPNQTRGKRKRQCNKSKTTRTNPSGSNADEVEENDCANFPRWKVVRHKRKVAEPAKPATTKQERIHRFGIISSEALHEVLLNNPVIARKISPEIVLHLENEALFDFLIPLLNDKLPKIEIKVKHQFSKEESTEQYNLFLRGYAEPMNKAIAAFKNKSFESVDAAVCSLSLVLRSFIVNFTVHRKRSYRNQDGTEVINLQCHTRNNMKMYKNDEELIEATDTPVAVNPKSKCCSSTCP